MHATAAESRAQPNVRRDLLIFSDTKKFFLNSYAVTNYICMIISVFSALEIVLADLVSHGCCLY